MKYQRLLIIIPLILILFTTPVYAHKLTITPQEGDSIKVNYADGSFSDQISLVLLNENKEEIGTAPIDEQGCFYYGDTPNLAYIVAQDNMGHRVQWKLGDPVAQSSSRGYYLKITAIVLSFLFIAVFFRFRTKKKAPIQQA